MNGETISKSLVEFLRSRVPDIKVEDIDAIVLDYVTRLLEDLEDSSSLDVEEFHELLTAYVPSSASLSVEVIAEWLFSLALEEKRRRETVSKGSTANPLDLSKFIKENEVGLRKSPVEEETVNKRTPRISETSDVGSESEEFQTNIENLIEMFPYACSLEVAHCLTLMSGDVDKAAHLIMHRHENGQNFRASQDRKVIGSNSKGTLNEKELKERIVGKYGYVDQAEDSRYHRPIIKKSEDKKLIRYRDGKIVSTKGERFTQVTKQESEEMKKTYVNINNCHF